MNNIIITVFMSFGFFLNSFAQENFLAGYYVNNEGDTIKGLIDYKSWNNNPESVSFKLNEKSSVAEFDATQVKMFSVSNDRYISAEVETEISSLKINLDNNSIPDIQIKRVFLLQIIEGPKTLLIYQDQKSKVNFYISENGNYSLLIYKKYTSDRNETKLLQENKRYIGQLTIYLNDCPEISSYLKNIEYSRKDLEKVFSSYYNCLHAKMDYYSPLQKTKLKVGIVTGVENTGLNFKNQFFDYLIEATFTHSNTLTFGVAFEFIFPRLREKFSMHNSIYYSSYSIDGHFESYLNDDNYSIVDTKFDFEYLKLLNMLRYKYYQGKADLFLNAGISNAIALSVVNELHKTGKRYSLDFIYDGKALDLIRTYEQGLVFGTGVQYKNFVSELRIEMTNGMSDYVNLGSTVTRLGLVFNYMF